MDACFTIQAKCRIYDIDEEMTENVIRILVDKALYEECGINADVRIFGLRYLEESEQE